VKIKSQKDFWSGLLFLAIGIGFAWGSNNYSFGSSARPGPGFFPFGLGVIMALLGAIVLFKALTLETAGGDPIGAIAWRPLIIVLGAVGLFGWLLPRAGLAVALPVLVILSSMASSEFSWVAAIVAAVVLTVGSWLIFVVSLGLVIPIWPDAWLN